MRVSLSWIVAISLAAWCGFVGYEMRKSNKSLADNINAALALESARVSNEMTAERRHIEDELTSERTLLDGISRRQTANFTQFEARASASTLASESLARDVKLASPPDLGHAHIDVRKFVINSQLSRLTDPVILVGDSITEAAIFPEAICCHAIVNAGIGSEWAKGYLHEAAAMFHDHEAALIVVALGTNDSTPGRSVAEFSAPYGLLLDTLALNGKLVLAGIPKTDAGLPLAASYIDPSVADGIDRAIGSIAASRNLPFIDLRAATDAPHLTADGIHLNADGYERWTTEIVAGISSALGCKWVDN